MANFEGLIRQAMASQNASDPTVRQRIYQSSRNALAKMLEKTGNTADEVVRVQFERLETSIASIEAEFAPAVQTQDIAPSPEVAQAEPVTEPAPEPEMPLAVETAQPAPVEARAEPEAPQADPEPEPAPEPVSPGLPEDYQPEPLFPPVTDEPAPAPLPDTELPQYESEPARQDFHLPDPEPVEEVQTPVVDTDLPPRAEPEMPQAAPEPYQPEPPQSEPYQPEPPQFDPPQPAPGAQMAAAQGYTPQQSAPPASEPYLDNDAVQPVGNGVDEFVETADQRSADDLFAQGDAGPVYKRRNPLLRRIWPIFLAIAVLLVILWILYALFAMNPDGTSGQAGNNENAGAATDGTVITLLRPTDLSALRTAGRGTAELVTELNQQMLRLTSTRPDGSRAGSAEPFELELEKGVLRQIDGKMVTVEFYSKSGGSGPAQFAVQCDFGGESICGRKRFRVGLQPERTLFSLDLSKGITVDENAFLAINTDITNAAETTGNGDTIDVIHVRLLIDQE